MQGFKMHFSEVRYIPYASYRLLCSVQFVLQPVRITGLENFTFQGIVP